MKDLFSKFPTPNAATASQSLHRHNHAGNIFNFREDMVKIDHVFGPKLTMNGKFLHDSNPTVEAGGLFTSMPVNGIATTSTHSPGHQYNISATYTPNAKFLIEAGYRYSYGAILSSVIGAENFSQSPDVETALANVLPFQNFLGRVPSISLTGGTGISDFGPYNDYNVNHTVYGNVTKVIGSHTLKFGAIYYHYNKHENQLTGSNNGSFSFDAQNAPTAATLFNGNAVCTGTAAAGGTCPFSFEQSFANFLLGQTSTFAQASLDVTANIFDNQFEYYGQDTWRVQEKRHRLPTASGTHSSVSPRMPAAPRFEPAREF